jgi:hypothetical protein
MRFPVAALWSGDGSDGPECLVEFGDGASVIGHWQRNGEAIDLHVPTYRTARALRSRPATGA